jgi:hypothetical protein
MIKAIRGSQGKAESNAPLLITVIIIAIVAFLAYKFVPVRWRYVKFKDEIQEVVNIDYARESRRIARGHFNEYTMRENVLAVAEKHNIPIEDAERQVSVTWPERKVFQVEIQYEEVVQLPVYGDYVWEFYLFVEQEN